MNGSKHTDIPQIEKLDFDLFAPSPDQHEDPEGWLGWRSHGVGGSDVKALLGEDKYRSLFQLWQEKVGLSYDEASESLMKMAKRGHKLEPLAADEFTEETGMKVRRINKGLVHPDECRWRGTIDRRINDQGDGRGPGTLEIKTVTQMAFRQILNKGARPGDVLQFHSNAAILGDSWGGLFYLQPDTWQTKWFPMEADPVIQEGIRDAIREFWPMVESKTPPAMDKKLDKVVKIPDSGGEVGVLTDDRFDLSFGDYEAAEAIIKEAEEMKKDARKVLELLMAEHGMPVAEGYGRKIFCRPQAGRSSFDKESFQHTHPEINLANFNKPGKPSTYFRIFPVKGA